MDFLEIGQKVGGFKFFNKGRDRKKMWDGVILQILQSLLQLLLQAANTKISKTHRLINKMLLCLSALLCLLGLVLPSPFSVADLFSVPGRSNPQNYLEF